MKFFVGLTTLLTVSLVWAGETRAQKPEVTFTEHIAPIIFEKCSSCHRKGQSGPFELLTYRDVAKRAQTIQSVIEDQYMPPWKPTNKMAYANDRRLSDQQKKLIDSWVDAGMPKGDESRMPKAPEFPDGWSLGKPDLVVKMKGEFEVPASGPDVYRSFVFEVDLPEDKWVKAVELRPKARGSVHHALFFVDRNKNARELERKTPGVGIKGMGFLRGGDSSGNNRLAQLQGGLAQGLGGYVPGSIPNKLPGDLAMKLPAKSDIVMQTHFHPTGKAMVEQAELGLYFAEKPPTRKLTAIQVPALFGATEGIDIPARKKDYTVEDQFTIPVDVKAIQVGGHAHYICQKMNMTATFPDGKTLVLMNIDDWDLDWQDQYLFKEPIDLPKGTVISTKLVYDNSSSNPENPHQPPRRITWGRQSTDEMGSVTLAVVADDDSDAAKLDQAVRGYVSDKIRGRLRSAKRFSSIASAMGQGNLIRRLDRNKDGKIEWNEVPERFRQRVFGFFDQNEDKIVDEKELKTGLETIEKLGKERTGRSDR